MKNGLKLLLLGIALTLIFSVIATAQRGYAAFGGEYTLLILPLVIGEAYRDFKGIKEAKK